MFLTEGLISCWSKLPGKAVDSSSPQVFISKLEVNIAMLNTAATGWNLQSVLHGLNAEMSLLAWTFMNFSVSKVPTDPWIKGTIGSTTYFMGELHLPCAEVKKTSRSCTVSSGTCTFYWTCYSFQPSGCLDINKQGQTSFTKIHTSLTLTGMQRAAIACISRTILTARPFTSGDHSHFFLYLKKEKRNPSLNIWWLYYVKSNRKWSKNISLLSFG